MSSFCVIFYTFLAGGTAVAQAPGTAAEDKASQKSKLLANLMGP